MRIQVEHNMGACGYLRGKRERGKDETEQGERSPFRERPSGKSWVRRDSANQYQNQSQCSQSQVVVAFGLVGKFSLGLYQQCKYAGVDGRQQVQRIQSVTACGQSSTASDHADCISG